MLDLLKKVLFFSVFILVSSFSLASFDFKKINDLSAKYYVGPCLKEDFSNRDDAPKIDLDSLVAALEDPSKLVYGVSVGEGREAKILGVYVCTFESFIEAYGFSGSSQEEFREAALRHFKELFNKPE